MAIKTEEFMIRVEGHDLENQYPRNFRLYEEYTRTQISDVMIERRINFQKADTETRRRNVTRVEEEVSDFRNYLVNEKHIETPLAHYYSISLKSVLLGVPSGFEIALLFDRILKKIDVKQQ